MKVKTSMKPLGLRSREVSFDVSYDVEVRASIDSMGGVNKVTCMPWSHPFLITSEETKRFMDFLSPLQNLSPSLVYTRHSIVYWMNGCVDESFCQEGSSSLGDSLGLHLNEFSSEGCSFFVLHWWQSTKRQEGYTSGWGSGDQLGWWETLWHSDQGDPAWAN